MEKTTTKHKTLILGKQSIGLLTPVWILSSACVVGTKEGEGPLRHLFDMIGKDDFFGSTTWEDAESTLQKEALSLAIGKSGLQKEDLRFLLAGDLLGQSIASSFGLMGFSIPLFGLYGACSTCGEALALGAILIGGGFAKHLGLVTSSHFAGAEKEFRYPLAYGSQRPPHAAWTVTGSGAFILSAAKRGNAEVKITGLTIGKIIDFGLKDSFHMGCAMAPAAAAVIAQNFRDFEREPKDYDKIITGDLGNIGQMALFDLLKAKGYAIDDRHMDCGIEIFDEKAQGTGSGGSGCGCAASVLSAYVLKEMKEGVWKRVLFVPTGALLSRTSFNQGKSVPGIAHAVVLEVGLDEE